MANEAKYKRVVLKLSGEALAGEKGYGIDPNVVNSIAGQIKEVLDCGLEIAVVNGGGNIWRGLSGANKGINDEATIGRRILLVQKICIETIPSLSKEANKWLEDQLKDIANDYTPARSRGFRR